jgi:hypothetical protein
MEILTRFERVYTGFIAVRMVSWRAKVGGYAERRESDAARLACEEEVWLCNIVNHLL